jgi:rhamnogalacturonyl hydrolase YesR
VDPVSPWLQVVEDYFIRWVATGSTWHVAETSYTCAYAMAALEGVRPGMGWGDQAVSHLLRQQAALVTKEGIWLRRSEDGSRHEFLNWSRGIAWYLLGLARSIPLLPPHSALIAEFTRASRWILGLQREDGLWGVFVHERDSLPDTSGSAGIAAALAIGVRQGWLPSEFQLPTRKCAKTLDLFLTDDGFLTGVAQSNKGGEDLQRGPLRVMAQFGLGPYGILLRYL